MGQAKKKGSATQSVSRRGLLRVAAGAVAVGAAMRPRRVSAQEKFTLKFQSGFPPKEPFHLITKITVERLGFVIPIGNVALSGKDRRLLEFYGPNGSIGPCGGILLQLDEFKRQARYAVGIVETPYRVWTPVPARIHAPIGSSIAVGIVAKHIASVIQDDIKNHVDA